MKTKKAFTAFPILVLMAIALLLAGCQAFGSAQQISSSRGEIISETVFDYEQAQENMAWRWIAMGRAYESHDLLTRNPNEISAGDIAAFRWTAMAHAYESHGMLTTNLTNFSAEDALAYRWIAMAQAYKNHGLLSQREVAREK